MTGFEAKAPIFPNPRTAEPLVITATKLAREVYLLTSSGLLSIAIEASATPGEYARAKSRPLSIGFVALISSLPGFGCA